MGTFNEQVWGDLRERGHRRQGPWRNVDDVELATLGYVDWFNRRRLHSEIGDIPPAELEASYHARSRTIDATTALDASTKSLRSNVSRTVELDNRPRTAPTSRSTIATTSKETN